MNKISMSMPQLRGPAEHIGHTQSLYSLQADVVEPMQVDAQNVGTGEAPPSLLRHTLPVPDRLTDRTTL